MYAYNMCISAHMNVCMNLEITGLRSFLGSDCTCWGPEIDRA